MKTITPYSIDFSLAGDFQEVVNRIKESLKGEGFGTLSEIDVQTTLREKIGKEIPPYTILGVCNPSLASKAIEAEPRIGVFLPCTVLVRQGDNEIQVNLQDPILMGSVVDNPALEPLAVEVRRRLVRALEAVRT